MAGMFLMGGNRSSTQQTVVNAGSSSVAFLNLAHGVSLSSTQTGYPGQLNADGHPTSGISASITNNDFPLIENYFGRYKVWWTGTGAFQLSPAMIVYSGGTGTQINAASGSVSQNLAFGFAGSSTQPTSGTPVEVAFGALVTAIADNGSGFVRLTSSGTPYAAVSAGAIYQVNNITNLAVGPYTVTARTNSTIDLNVAYNGTMAVVGGGAGPQSEAILSISSCQWTFPAQGASSAAYSGFGGLTFCRSADVAGVLAGRQVNPDYVNIFKSLNPRFIRFMDYSSVQGNRSTSYTYRPKTTQLSWRSNNSVLDYWGGTITNGGSDVYTMAANPTASPVSGAYVDGEVVSGVISGANTGYNPTLAITGRTGSAPIVPGTISMLSLTMTGAVPASTKIVTLIFTGGGLASPRTLNYTVQAGDTTFNNLAVSLRAAINADATLSAAGIVSANADVFGSPPQMTLRYNPNINSSGVAALGTGLTVTGSDNASAATYNFGFVWPNFIVNNQLASFTYSALAGAWVSTLGNSSSPWQEGGTHGGPPLEFYEDFCLQANVGLWFNVPILYSATSIYNTVLHIARSGVKELALEMSNETWNSSLGEWAAYKNLGEALGLHTAADADLHGYTGLQTIQMAAQARAAWAAAGRLPSQLFIVTAYQFVNPSGAQTNRFNGGNLTPGSNVTLAAYGGPVSNGTTTPTGISTNYSAFPNRPVDKSDLLSPAPYWSGAQFNARFGGSINMGVPLAAYNSALVAAYNYANGSASDQQTSLDFLFNGTSGDLYNGTLNSTTNNGTQLASWAHGSGDSAADYFGITTIVAAYDSARSGGGLSVLGVACYEGDHESGPTKASDATTIASNLTSLGITNGYTSGLGGAVGGGPTSTAATDATNMLTLLTAFKNDSRFKLLYLKYLNDFKTAVQSQGARIALPGTYGFEAGPTYWSKYPGSIYTTAYKSIEAIGSFDG